MFRNGKGSEGKLWGAAVAKWGDSRGTLKRQVTDARQDLDSLPRTTINLFEMGISTSASSEIRV